MKLAFIGIGKVGFALANNFQKLGHEIFVTHTDLNSKSIVESKAKNPAFSMMLPQDAIDVSDIIFLATPFKANEEILKPLKFSDKTLVDCTNPIGVGIAHGLESKISGAEMVQEWAKGANVVKSFSIYGYENLENPVFPNYELKPVMLIAGNNTESKKSVGLLNAELGFETLDTGTLSQALHLEHMTLLWVKMVRTEIFHPNFTWAYLKR